MNSWLKPHACGPGNHGNNVKKLCWISFQTYIRQYGQNVYVCTCIIGFYMFIKFTRIPQTLINCVVWDLTQEEFFVPLIIAMVTVINSGIEHLYYLCMMSWLRVLIVFCSEPCLWVYRCRLVQHMQLAAIPSYLVQVTQELKYLCFLYSFFSF